MTTVRLPAKRKQTEGDISKEIRDALDKMGILNWRMQAGGYRGRARGLPAGTPDILAAVNFSVMGMYWPRFLWIEVKKPGGRISDEQLAFADKVKMRGHHWLCVESLKEVISWLKENRAK